MLPNASFRCSFTSFSESHLVHKLTYCVRPKNSGWYHLSSPFFWLLATINIYNWLQLASWKTVFYKSKGHVYLHFYSYILQHKDISFVIFMDLPCFFLWLWVSPLMFFCKHYRWAKNRSLYLLSISDSMKTQWISFIFERNALQHRSVAEYPWDTVRYSEIIWRF